MSLGENIGTSSSRFGVVDGKRKSTEISACHGRPVQECCLGTAASISRRNVRSSNIECHIFDFFEFKFPNKNG